MERSAEIRTETKKPFAIFDIDGTVARDSLFLQVLEGLWQKNLIEPAVWQSLLEARSTWLRRNHDAAYDDYIQMAVRALYNDIAPGLSVADYETVVKDVLDEVKDFTYRYPLKLMESLRLAGYSLVALSGSPHQAVTSFGQYHNFDHWQGSEYVEEGGYFTGEVHSVAKDKGRYLEELVSKQAWEWGDSVGIGDTISDIPVLSRVEHPICFNPSQELLNEAIARNWSVVVERKNVIYHLNEPATNLYQHPDCQGQVSVKTEVAKT